MGVVVLLFFFFFFFSSSLLSSLFTLPAAAWLLPASGALYDGQKGPACGVQRAAAGLLPFVVYRRDWGKVLVCLSHEFSRFLRKLDLKLLCPAEGD